MIGQRLKQLREEKGLSQQQLADLVNLSQQTIGHYEVERAEPSIKTLEMFADIFDTTTDYILGRTHVKKSTETSAPLRADDSKDDLPPEVLEEIELIKDYVIDRYRKKKRGGR